jgi:thioester reductase-like protein
MGQGFNNTYEQSKFEAETLIRRYKEAGLPISVFRPSILTGDSAGGRTNNFKMLYQPLHFFANELFDAVPARHSSEQNLMPADIAASQIVAIAKNPDSFGKTFHIASLSTMTVGHFVDVASDFFGFKAPEFIPVEEFDRSRLSNVQRFLIEPFVPYFNYKIRFDITNAARALKASHAAPYAFSDDTLLKLFTFCADSGFIKPKRQYVAS